MRALILAFALGLALTASAQAAPLSPISIPQSRVDQAGARSMNVVSIVGGFGIKSTRSASA